MANVDIANGFNPTGMIYGLGRYETGTAIATAIFKNDLLSMLTSGYVRNVVATETVTVGAVMGTTAASTAQKALVPASTAATVLISDDPGQKYIAQDDGDGTALTRAEIGSNCDVIAGAGNTTTGLSGHEIDGSTNGTTGQIRLLDIQRRGDNAIGANADWVCRINEHFYATTTGV
jgi:hypothetical protein